MKVIPLFLLVGILAVSGWAVDKVTYSPELLKNAELGDATSQCNLGVCYLNGTEVNQDYKESVKWFKKAAEQGNAVAQYYLGICYFNGTEVRKDEKEAVKLFTRSAEQGNADAKQMLEALKNSDSK
jgi:TPR repeat protein